MARGYPVDAVNAKRTMPEWFKDAACIGRDPDIFFPGPGQLFYVDEAKRICATCPIKWSCRRWALDTNQRFGIWGGTTQKERIGIRRKERRSNVVHI